jgi:hypothetical protein
MAVPTYRLVLKGAVVVLPAVVLVGGLLSAAAQDVDCWSVLCPAGVLAEEQCRGENLDRVEREIRHRSEAKAAVVRALADGQLTLFQAAVRFRDLDRASPTFHWSALRDSYEGSTDDERHCREVIRHIGTELPEESPKTQELLRRLKAELREALDHGPVRLETVSLPYLSVRARATGDASANR